jgi:hypothetical protein
MRSCAYRRERASCSSGDISEFLREFREQRAALGQVAAHDGGEYHREFVERELPHNARLRRDAKIGEDAFGSVYSNAGTFPSFAIRRKIEPPAYPICSITSADRYVQGLTKLWKQRLEFFDRNDGTALCMA